MIQKITLTAYHSVCICKMGEKSDPNRVADPRLRVVVGVKNLSEITSGNTNAPVMIAEKAADMIKDAIACL